MSTSEAPPSPPATKAPTPAAMTAADALRRYEEFVTTASADEERRVPARDVAHLGHLLNQSAKWFEARALLAPYALAQGADAGILAQYGYALLQSGRDEEAAEMLARAVAGAPGDSKSGMRLVGALAGRGMAEEASRLLDGMGLSDASLANTLASAGKRLVETGHADAARGFLRRALDLGCGAKLAPQAAALLHQIDALDEARHRHALLSFDRGRLCQSLYRFAEAADWYSQAMSDDPDVLTHAGLLDDGRRKPDFLLIGAPRSGTTWLKHNLSFHPELLITNGEPEFFSRDIALGLEFYFSLFRADAGRFKRDEGKSPQARIGEKSAFYAGAPEAHVRLCRAVLPDLRLIYMVRDPIERAWSHMKKVGAARACEHLLASGFPDAARALVEPIVLHSRYEANLAVWLRSYPADRFLVVNLDEIKENPHEVMRHACAHIGVDGGFDFSEAFASFKIDQSRTARVDMPVVVRDLLGAMLGEGWTPDPLRAMLEG